MPGLGRRRQVLCEKHFRWQMHNHGVLTYLARPLP